MRVFFALCLLAVQAREFEIAQIQVSPKRSVQNRSTKATGSTYEVRNATMVDLISIAWSGFPADRIVGGPNWLELDRFDVIGRLPPNTTAEERRQMLRPLLEQRFKLVVHNDTVPLPTWALTAGKKIQLKEADGKGEPGCRQERGPTTGLGMLRFHCRNISMAAVVESLRGMGVGRYTDYEPISDRTNLEGKWDFDIAWVNPAMREYTSEKTTFPQAIEKFGLKLERVPLPTPVLVVDSVDRSPSENPPGSAEAFPAVAAATEFEVATVKPSAATPGASRYMTPAGGRLDCERMPLSFLITRAFPVKSRDQLAGIPAWADSAQFDIAAKAPTAGLPGSQLDGDTLQPMMLALLKERFGMTWHTEERVVPAYSLKAVKPKFRKADPASRTRCGFTYGPPDAAPGSLRLSCRNVTMAEFAERLQGNAVGLGWPVLDATSLDGAWDLTLTYLQNPGATAMAMRRMSDPGTAAGNLPDATEPIEGHGIFEAVEKQLGLKLEPQKRSEKVIVIDHLEQAPKEN